MKQFMKVVGLAGMLVFVLTIRALAAPKAASYLVSTNTPQAQNTSSSGQNTGPWRSMMGGNGQMGHMGRGMMAGNGYNMAQESMMAGVMPMYDDVAMQLGMTTEDLYHQMASGTSLVQLAAEKGGSEQQLMDGIMAGRHAVYDQAVREGYMTQAQADTMLQYLNSNLSMMVNGQGVESSVWSMMWDTQPGDQTPYRMHE